MLPTNDDITTGWVVAMIQEVPASKFELYPDSLPPLTFAINTSLSFTVGITGLDSLNNESKFIGNDAEQENDSLLVDRSVAEATKVNRSAKVGAGSLCPNTLSSRLERCNRWSRKFVSGFGP
jgi:hypothetical protein